MEATFILNRKQRQTNDKKMVATYKSTSIDLTLAELRPIKCNVGGLSFTRKQNLGGGYRQYCRLMKKERRHKYIRQGHDKKYRLNVTLISSASLLPLCGSRPKFHHQICITSFGKW